MRRTQGDWAGIVARYRTSGLSVRRFSAVEAVSEQSLRNWTRKLWGPRFPQTRRDTGFVEIGGTARPGQLEGEGGASEARCELVIRLESGVGIEVQPETERELLGWVLTLLRHAS